MGEGESEDLQGSKMVTNIHHLFINKLYRTNQGYVFWLQSEQKLRLYFERQQKILLGRNSLSGPKDCNADWRSDD